MQESAILAMVFHNTNAMENSVLVQDANGAIVRADLHADFSRAAASLLR
jgi:hypothetical protein